ncbi:MAG: alpha/beta fold hydrolase [Anaerolineae bacterium]
MSSERVPAGRKAGVPSLLGATVGAVASATLGLAAGWIGYSRLAIDHDVPLAPALEAERRELHSPLTGLLSWYEDRQGEGRPLVLVHSVNAAASAYEMRPLFDHYRGRRPLWALDLPGFGFSERSDRAYTPELFAQAILDMLREVGEPADVVALSLGCEFAARAALLDPVRFHTLACLSPSGLNALGSGRSSQQVGVSGAGQMLHRVLASPVWGLPLYDLIATRRSITFFLQQSFVGQVPHEMVEYAYATAHQPGAEHAPLAFVSGTLFTPDARTRLYEKIQMPSLMLYDQDPFVRFDTLPDLLAANVNWRAERITPTYGLPHWDNPAATTAALGRFWQSIGERAAAPAGVLQPHS